MRKKHQAIYDDGYASAIRDVTIELLNSEEYSRSRTVEVIKQLIKPIEERYSLNNE